MPPNPDSEFNAEEDKHVEFLQDLLGRLPNKAWLDGDQEFYPVWPTTLWEQDQIWRTHFNLRTSNQRIERLAQEVSLYVAINDIAHEA